MERKLKRNCDNTSRIDDVEKDGYLG